MEDSKPLLFTLFRVQVHFPAQGELYRERRSPEEVLRVALQEKPTVQHPRGSWHIGNVTDILPNGLYFAVGKQLARQVGELDEDGDFHNQTTLVAPNTHAILDLSYQVLGIAANNEVAPKPSSVASKLRKLLQETEVVRSQSCRISIDPIRDPAGFIESIERAAAVTKFQVTYGLPNVWDVEKDFQQPFQKTASEMGSDRSVATFAGEDLDKGKLVKLARAAAAIGKPAKAWIRRTRKQRPVPISTKENPALQAAANFDPSHLLRWAQETVVAIRATYEEIRDRE